MERDIEFFCTLENIHQINRVAAALLYSLWNNSLIVRLLVRNNAGWSQTFPDLPRYMYGCLFKCFTAIVTFCIAHL